MNRLALHDIPADAQTRLGRRRFVQSLHTENYNEAKAKGALLEAEWRAEIEGAARGSSPTPWLPDWAKAYRAAAPGDRGLISMAIDDHAGQLYPNALVDPEMEGSPEYEKAVRFVGIAHGQKVPLADHLPAYLGTLKLEARTIAVRGPISERLVGQFPTAEDVSRRSLQEWINGQQAAGVSAGTIRYALSAARGFWRYLRSLKLWPKITSLSRDLIVVTANGIGKDDRKPFTPPDVLKLLDEARKRGDGQLGDLIQLAMWSGARIEELCSLKVEHVGAHSFKIVDAKTRAGQREIPIHSKLAPTMTRLTSTSTDGFVLSGGLKPDKYGDRKPALGRRFSIMKTAMGFGPNLVLHSIRKTVSTMLEQAGVPENVAADILGHKKRTMSYGLYSGGTSLEQKREAIEKLDYSH